MNYSLKMFKLIGIWWLLVAMAYVRCSESVESICQTEERFTVLEEKNTTHPVRIRSYNWCLSFPPRCSNYRTEMRDVIKVQNVTKTKLIDHCCDGFNNINSNNNNNNNNSETIVCSPVCRGGCGHGICESPNTCVCDIGYEGRHCSQRCRSKWFGKNCKNICKCRNNSLCDHRTGFCRCAVGWIGEFCELPCPAGYYGMMCHEKCSCNNRNCDAFSGKCLGERAKIVFDVAHNRSSSVTKLSSDRIKAKHWISVNGNGKINFRNCSDPTDQCELNNGNTTANSIDQNDIHKTALIQELNANVTNLTEELKAATEKSIVIVNTSIAIHHIHKGVKNFTGAARNTSKTSEFDGLITHDASTELNHIETENQEGDFQRDYEHTDHNKDIEESDEIDNIGGYDHIVHVFAVSSINTTKSEQIVSLPPVVPVALILLIVMCVAFIIIFVAIHFNRKSKASQTQTDSCTTPDDITLSDQIVQKPLPEIPSSFTQSITRHIMQHDFYDRPSNNKSVKSGLNKLGYCYADDDVNNRPADESGACDEHIYDEIKYSNYCGTTRR